jgi:hypothetical protein
VFWKCGCVVDCVQYHRSWKTFLHRSYLTSKSVKAKNFKSVTFWSFTIFVKRLWIIQISCQNNSETESEISISAILWLYTLCEMFWSIDDRHQEFPFWSLKSIKSSLFAIWVWMSVVEGGIRCSHIRDSVGMRFLQ